MIVRALPENANLSKDQSENNQYSPDFNITISMHDKSKMVRYLYESILA